MAVTGPTRAFTLSFSALSLASGCGGTTGPDTGTAQPGPSASYGYVYVSDESSTPMGEVSSALAGFQRSGSAPQCAVLTSENDCDLLQCAVRETISPDLDAGEVTVEAKQQIKAKRGVDGTYRFPTIQGALWSPGGTITVRVDGNNDDPPAFTTALTAPDSVSVTQPLDSAVVDRAQDLEFAWTGAADGYFFVNTSRNPRISCRWVAADTSRVVPSSLLSRLPAGTIIFTPELDAPTSGALIGDWKFSAEAAWVAAPITVTLQ